MMANPPNLSDLPALPREDDGPVFRAPWEAQAFAMAVRLYEQGHFTWTEWAAALSRQIGAAQHDRDPGDGYYLHWLAALETLAAEKGLTSADELTRRKQAWAHVAETTPHGQPLVLPDEEHVGRNS